MKNLILAVIVAALVAVGIIVAVNNHSSKQTNKSSASTANNKPATKTSEPTVNNAVLATKSNASMGNYLADPNGNALYTYDKDANGVSNCTGQCLVEWPAYQARGAASSLPAGVATITRTDNGQMQYTYNGKPLYYFKNDTAGQVTGNGVDGFTVAKPAAAPEQQSAAPSSSPNYAY